MQDYEKLGVFYLGKIFDTDQKKLTNDLLLYDSKDLVTHGVCVGMTGSGKTGLCIDLLEEAAIDGIPSIIVDPKGDLSNLMLTFPQLRGEDFLPWIHADDARSKGASPEDYAAQQAALWKKGLADWDQDGSRIQRLKDSAEFTIYTPGSTAGRPLSILKSFTVPDKKIMDDSELLRERIVTTVTSLLGLLGIEANPIQSREHILLSTIFDTAWKQGQNLDLAALIRLTQTPGFNRVGVFDLESFYPSKDRFSLAMMMNNLLAAPGFDIWMQGEALDPGALLFNSAGKPRVSILSISHLNDSERMFFVSLLLTQLLGWTRSQSGTSSLRALFYMDEIAGYFPPVANPPSKGPLLTLLKQARAFGLGVLLATQNPVDLDYKGLSNAGTWFIGRLQTEQDKARLLDGLEGASNSFSARFDRSKMESILSGLQSRTFLLNNVHEDQPQIFQTRWALSYLAGPMTREQIQSLRSKDPAPVVQPSGASSATAPQASAAVATPSIASQRPSLPPGVPQFFIPLRGMPSGDDAVMYKPQLLGIGKIYYADAKVGVAADQDVACLLALDEDRIALDWQNGEIVSLSDTDLEKFPAEDASYATLPGEASNAKNYDKWNKQFADWLFRTQSLKLFRSPSLSEVSKPGEQERDFRIRLQQMAREQRDRVVAQLRKQYATKSAALQDRLQRAQVAVQRESEQAKQAKMQTAISFGTTVLGALFGRKKLSMTTLGKATTAARGVGRSMKESEDIDRAQESVQSVQQQIADLETEIKTETDRAVAAMDPQTESLETYELKPKKGNLSIKLVALTWSPYLKDAQGNLAPAWK